MSIQEDLATGDLLAPDSGREVALESVGIQVQIVRRLTEGGQGIIKRGTFLQGVPPADHPTPARVSSAAVVGSFTLTIEKLRRASTPVKLNAVLRQIDPDSGSLIHGCHLLISWP